MAVAYASMRRRSCRICSRIWSSGSPVIYSYLRRQYRSEASCKESFANMFINPISPDSLLGVICAVRDGIFPIFMTFGVIAFVVAGALYLMAAGDQTKVAKAKKALMFGVIGVSAAIISLGAAFIIAEIFGVAASEVC